MYPIKTLFPILVFFSTLAVLPAEAEDVASAGSATLGKLRWQTADGQSVALVGDHGPVWQFHYGPEIPKPFFHPVALHGDHVITANSPPDHRWHHGLWFSWKYINEVNYWEPADREAKTYAGRTLWKGAKIETREDFSANIRMDLQYKGTDDVLVMTEQRTIEIAAPDPNGLLQMDWKCVFTAAGKDVTLDRTPFSTTGNGQPWGGYAGLSCRFTLDFEDRQACTADEVATYSEDRSRPLSIAAEYNGKVEGVELGMAMLNHQDNLRDPTYWYIIRSKVMSYINAALLTYEPLVIPAGESLTLKYRVIVHPGRWDGKKLKEESETYNESDS
ncbi:DUF6807 family protein [Novipirellula artificiosorum]|uniref:Methane oxygenase PmoA n=1 Tax=Novipirellula artificiosorum TaxID=2528016 RepID=A0A5C6DTX9_9BACT|nr:DUF6807 family protein [Novipirellula artificiosorum]TWU40813.1 hypothetical protein Poly41_16480 [Novipirellula artificiosorum]